MFVNWKRHPTPPDAGAVRTDLRASDGPRCWYLLNRLQVVARDQPGLAVGAVYFGLPPPIVLVAENGQYIPLIESELLGDGCLVHIHGACWRDTRSVICG